MLQGYVCIILASVAFGLSPVCATQMMAFGMDAQNTLVWTSGFAALGAGAVILIRRDSLKVTGKQFRQLLLFCGGGYGLTALLLTHSYRFLPIGLATMFHFIYPLIVTIIMARMNKMRIPLLRKIGILTALLGLALTLDLSGKTSLPGVLLSLGSGVTYAVYVVANRQAAYKELSTVVVVFYTALFNTICFSLLQLMVGKIVFPPSRLVWLLAVGGGLFTRLLALLTLTQAVRRIGASNAAIGNMLEPLTSLVAGAVIYSDRIPPHSWAGCVLILSAILLIVLHEKHEKYLQNSFLRANNFP